jgi:conjugal transfer pilus assembly protein TraD
VNESKDNQGDVTSRIYVAILIVFLTVLLTPALLVGLLYSWVLRRQNLNIWVHVGVLGFFALSVFFLQNHAIDYMNAIKNLVKTLSIDGFNWTAAAIMGISIGPVLGAGLEIWYIKRPEWVKSKEPVKETDFDAPRFKKKLNALSKTAHPPDGIAIGVNENAEPVILKDTEMNNGCLILGATGSGKTTTLNNIIESCCQREIPVIFVDGKGSKKQAAMCMKLAQKYGRPFYYFSMSGTSHNYNPLALGDPTELKDKLISISEWTEPHYKAICERYLQNAFYIFKLTGIKVDIVNVVNWLTPHSLNILLRQIPEDQRIRYEGPLDEINEKGVAGLLNRLAVFSESEVGPKLTADAKIVINLYEAVKEKAIVVMSLESLRFPEFSRALGKIIVTDLKTVASRLLEERHIVYDILDEFGVFAGPQVTDLINKSREAGFHNVLSTQELADLRYEGKKELMEQVFGNTNVKLIHRQDVPESAAFIAESAGTTDSFSTTFQVDGTSETGAGTVTKDKSFLVHPDRIKRLGTGRAVLIKKTPDFVVDNIKIRMVEVE